MIITQLVRHTRYLRTLKGQPPLRLAGMETYARLSNVACLRLDWLAKRYAPRLAQKQSSADDCGKNAWPVDLRVHDTSLG
jgi:hypothetical protein